jgi:zinc protease
MPTAAPLQAARTIRPLTTLAVLGVALVTSPPGVASPQRAKLDSLVSSTTLENGLQVIAQRNPTLPIVTVELVVRAGAFTQENQSEAGLAHLIEHMLFRTGGDGSIEAEAAEIDAISNGVTGTEAVQFFFTFPSRHLAAGLALMSRMIRRPGFTAEALTTERDVVRGELQRRASEPELLLGIESDALLWGAQAWTSKSPGGNLIALNGATPERLRALYNRFYVPNNAALIVTGDVTDTTVFKLAAREFRGWKRGGDPFANLQPVVIQPLKTAARKVVSATVKDVTLLVRWQGPSVRAHPAATYAADVFAGLINQPVSQTQRRLVDGGVVDELSMSYETLNNVGPVALVARTSVDRATAAAAALGAEILRLAGGDFFDHEDLVLAKKWQRVAAHHVLESSQATAHLLAQFWSVAGLDYYLAYLDELEAQTSDDVRRFVREYIAGKPLAVVAMVPEDAGPSLRASMQRALAAWQTP